MKLAGINPTSASLTEVAQVALSAVLVTYYFGQNPDPQILSHTRFRPIGKDGTLVVGEKNRVRVEDWEDDVVVPDPSEDVWDEISYVNDIDRIELAIDIGNKGRSGTTIHELVIHKVENVGDSSRTAEKTHIIPTMEGSPTAHLVPEESTIRNVFSLGGDLSPIRPTGLDSIFGEVKSRLKRTNGRKYLQSKERISESIELTDELVSLDEERKTEWVFNIELYSTDANPTDRIWLVVKFENEEIRWRRIRWPAGYEYLE